MLDAREARRQWRRDGEHARVALDVDGSRGRLHRLAHGLAGMQKHRPMACVVYRLWRRMKYRAARMAAAEEGAAAWLSARCPAPSSI